MTNTKTTKTTKVTFKTTDMLRKGFRAYIGAYGVAYERAQPRIKNVSKNYDEFAAKGENIEQVAQSYINDARLRAEKRFNFVARKVRGVLPVVANDQTAKLEAEITDLNKKIAKLTKKAAKKAA